MLTTVIMAPARVEPRVGATLDDSNSGSVESEESERCNSRSTIWAYKNTGFGSFGTENDHPHSKIFDFHCRIYLQVETPVFGHFQNFYLHRRIYIKVETRIL